MTNEEFKLWLSGFFTLAGEGRPLTRQQLFIIGNHANLAEAVEGRLDDDVAGIRAIVRETVPALAAPEEEADVAVTEQIRLLLG